MRQLITPTPDIPCAPGWCLQYVRQTFGLPARYGSATEAWEESGSQHRDRNFPRGLWTPVWYGLDTTPLGHVVLLAPDGSVYSTSDLTNTPHHHPDLADLEAYYAHYGMNLTYRGWTEDVAGYPVMAPAITAQSTTILEEDDMTKEQYDELRAILVETQVRTTAARENSALAVRIATENQRRISVTRDVVKQIAAKTGTAIDYDRIDTIVDSSLAAGVDVRITVNGEEVPGA